MTAFLTYTIVLAGALYIGLAAGVGALVLSGLLVLS